MTATTDERALLAASVNDFVQRGTGVARVRQLRETHAECDRAVWKQLAGLGWLGVLVPEDCGGSGLSLAEAAVVAEGVGRALLPEPYTACAVLAARVLERSENAALRRAQLTRLAAGDGVPVVAWQEEAGTLDVAASRTVAAPFEGGLRISGEKRFVVGAAGADGFIVSAVDGPAFHLAWVPRESAGCAVDCALLADGRCYGTVRMNDVVVPRENMVASGAAAREALARAVDHAAVVAGAELCGVMRRALDLSLDYLRTRVQFGRPIGSFQALQHRAVDAYLQQELASAVLDEALVALATEPAAPARSVSASRVKARCSDAALHITRQAIQFHGAMGFTEDCDVGLYVKRAITVSAWLGNGTVHRRRYARLTAKEGA